MDKKLTRRDLLKAIIAGSGGIVAASFVPEKWLKPVVKSGVLPAHAQASTPEPTPTQNYVEGRGFIDGDLFAEAFVSAVPFTFPDELTNSLSKYKLASPKKVITVPTDQPVEGVEVTLWINEVEYPEKKTTDVNGHVEWLIPDEVPADAPSISNEGIILKFVIDGDEDVYVVPLIF